jgi:hypothetical protein
MKKYIISLLVFCFVNVFYFSQAQDKVQSIRTLYQKVNESIAACKGEECSLFCNEVTVNSKNKSWRAVGIFKQNIQFWYSDQPEFYKESYPEQGENGVGALEKINVETKSTYKENKEFLFEEGKLVFFYYTYAYNQEPMQKQEYRFYFSNDQLIKFIATTSVAEKDRMYKEKDWKIVLSGAKEYQKLFLKTF